MSCKWKFTWTLFVMQIVAFVVFVRFSVSEQVDPSSGISYFFILYRPAVMFAADGGPIAIQIFILLSMFVYSLILGWVICRLLRLETS